MSIILLTYARTCAIICEKVIKCQDRRSVAECVIFPEVLEFSLTGAVSGEPIVLMVDQLETTRLIDKENLSQEECGAQLGVGRTTAQKIYETAREKIADALVLGFALKIEGGELQHFGHTEQFKLYDIEDGKVIKTQLIDTNGSDHGALAGVLSAVRAYVLIGGGAQMALAANGIKLYGGVSGNADEAVNAFVAGNLAFNPDVHCEHHDHEHGGETHICGDYGCGH